MTSPALDHDLSLLKRVEDLTIEQLIAYTVIGGTVNVAERLEGHRQPVEAYCLAT